MSTWIQQFQEINVTANSKESRISWERSNKMKMLWDYFNSGVLIHILSLKSNSFTVTTQYLIKT